MALNTQHIVSLSLVKNEGDIIEAMVRQNLRFVDHMYFVDNGSVDGTLEILTALAEETGRVSVSHDHRLGYVQKEIMNENMRAIHEQVSPDHLIPLDGDEIILADPTDFRATLASDDAPLLLPWRTFVPTEHDDPKTENPLERITHHRRRERPQYYKVTVPNRLMAAADFSQGSHSLFLDGKKLEATVPENLVLGHWPVRSIDQIITKALIGSWNIKQRTSDKSQAYQWHEITDTYLKTGRVSQESFLEMGLMYAAKKPARIVEDTGVWGDLGPLKYSQFINRSPLYLISVFVDGVFEQQLKSKA